MTLQQRNRFFIAGIALSSICILGALVQFGHFVAVYPELIAGAARRAPGFLQILAEKVFPASAWASLVSVCAAALFALAASIVTYFFFEKTHCPEILFFGLFSASFAFEILRFLIPLKQVYGFSGIFLGEGARILFFGRFFGVLAFFAASVYAAGFEMQKQGIVVVSAAVAALAVSLGIPFDSLSWDTNLVMNSGYTGVFRIAEAGILLLSIAGFFISARSRGSREYIAIGLGAVFLSLGRDLILSGDTWLSPLPGFVLLCVGEWLAVSKLHQVYLWM
jgi:hypothetical protein